MKRPRTALSLLLGMLGFSLLAVDWADGQRTITPVCRAADPEAGFAHSVVASEGVDACHPDDGTTAAAPVTAGEADLEPSAGLDEVSDFGPCLGQVDEPSVAPTADAVITGSLASLAADERHSTGKDVAWRMNGDYEALNDWVWIDDEFEMGDAESSEQSVCDWDEVARNDPQPQVAHPFLVSWVPFGFGLWSSLPLTVAPDAGAEPPQDWPCDAAEPQCQRQYPQAGCLAALTAEQSIENGADADELLLPSRQPLSNNCQEGVSSPCGPLYDSAPADEAPTAIPSGCDPYGVENTWKADESFPCGCNPLRGSSSESQPLSFQEAVQAIIYSAQAVLQDHVADFVAVGESAWSRMAEIDAAADDSLGWNDMDEFGAPVAPTPPVPYRGSADYLGL